MAKGVSAEYVDANTDMMERAYINRRFRDGEVQVICSVRTMTTGVDLPVSCIIDAAPTKSEMLHVQKIGRGLRVNPGSEDCLILDHAGNSIRLGLVADIHHVALNRQAPGEKQEAKPKAEKLPKPCTQCGTLHSGAKCPSCGHERKPVAGVDVAEGELIELTGRKVAETMADKQRFWSMALWVDQQRGKGGRLAKGLYKGRFGVWPRGLDHRPAAPDQGFLNYERSRRIAYAKKMGAK
jgi:superfamily II DNA or RNA helicase